MNLSLFRWAPAVVLSLPLLALAQPRAETPGAKAPALRYHSAFADYKPWRDVEPADWRQLNDALAKAPGGAGGHAGHAMGTSSPAAPSPAPKASAPAGAAHQGHQMHHHHGGTP